MSRPPNEDGADLGERQMPSPRTTIVGGRPPEQEGGLPPVPTGIQRLLRLASVDPEFRQELVERRGELAAAAEIPLTPSEAAILAAIPAAQLDEMAVKLPPPPAPRRAFLRRTAATAVVLLGGAALAEGAAGCRKPTSDPNPPGTQEADGDGGPADPPKRPDNREMESEGGASPHPPPPRAEKREIQETGGAAPDLPPERPTDRPTTTKGGSAPDLPDRK